jgi:SH3-like domain-containing protein
VQKLYIDMQEYNSCREKRILYYTCDFFCFLAIDCHYVIKHKKHIAEDFMKKGLISIFILFGLLVLTDYAQALCVSVAEANLRGGPGTKYEKTWEVFKYMPFNKLSKKGGWYKVRDVDGDVHWIFSSLVTEKFQCAVVKVEKANIRTGPGTKYSKSALSPALKYDSYKVLKIKSSWVHVMDEFGDKGWISRKLLWVN